ncbi:Response regulator of zinc sigma-54-dependent two-component system [hydrothermal vent metagenome]|uniref:Response regulator of zinc sigma-54-dependent two-component system n=1 Tax=hydrothermal vent metagenome TaxID=652676 RepID=A0A3B1C0I4_9ZZZZ
MKNSVDLENAELIKTVLDSITESIKILDQEYNLVYTNKAGLDFTGKSEKEILGGNCKCFKTFYENPKQCSWCIVEQVFKNGVPAFNTFTVETKGKPLLKEVSAFPLKNETGEVGHVIEIVRDITGLQTTLSARSEFSEIISESPSMEGVFGLIKSVAVTDATVLIYGETGTGKELIARAIHMASSRVNKKIVAINCGALSDSLLETELFGHEKGAFTGATQRRIGKFEEAHNGTLFLDEIGDISANMQVKILRALQEGEITRVGGNEIIKIDVRFICATNVDLKLAVENGTFREDLYYRINVVPVSLPPLRERGNDIELLANHYLEKFGVTMGKKLRGFTADVMRKMNGYNWPGNIRELRNLVERAVILNNGPLVNRIDIPEKSGKEIITYTANSDLELKDVVAEAEREYLSRTLKMYNGNINQTAEKAGVNTRTIHRKMREFGLTKELFKS